MANQSNKERYSMTDKMMISFVLLSFVAVAIMCMLTKSFLSFNETRLGFLIWDPIHPLVDPIKMNIPIFTITYIAIAIGLVFALTSSAKILQTNLTICSVLLLRIICMYCIPLNPPEAIIPLIDPFLTSTFYGDEVLVRDLFFSGHTASMVLLALLVDNRILSRILWGLSVVVGSMLIIQHVHYTLDVVAAYGFAWAAFRVGTWMSDYVVLYSRLYGMLLTKKFRYSS